MMQQKELINGKTINLRNVNVDDAAFILKLRLDPDLNLHLSQTDPELAKQVAWIEQYRQEGKQFYFIIEDKMNNPVGTVRIYDLQADSFCWGSWIVQPGAPQKTALESALLVYEFGFYALGYQKCHFDVRKENSRVVEFHKRFGASIVDETEQDYFFNFTLADYEIIRKRYHAFLPISEAS